MIEENNYIPLQGKMTALCRSNKDMNDMTLPHIFFVCFIGLYETKKVELLYLLASMHSNDYATAERYAAFDMANDRRSIVALMDSLINAGTQIGPWSSLYYSAMEETLPYDSILPRLLQLQDREPANIPVYTSIGYTYNRLGDTQKAVESFSKGLDLAPDASHLWYGLGMVTLQQGDTVSAVNNLRKAHELAKEHNLESWAIRIQLTLDSITSSN